MISSKTHLKYSFQRIVFAATGVIALASSSVSPAQFVESDFYPTDSCIDCCQHDGCEFASQHRCVSCPRIGGGNLAGYVSGVRSSAAILRHRDTPPGNMGLRFPYQANQMYYYRRPYNDYHVPTHVRESQDSPAQSTFGRNLGYSNQIFEHVHSTAAEYHESHLRQGGGIEKDGILEFVDWPEHRQSRLTWQETPRYQRAPRDGSYPYLNEEVRNQRANGPPDFEIGKLVQPVDQPTRR